MSTPEVTPEKIFASTPDPTPDPTSKDLHTPDPVNLRVKKLLPQMLYNYLPEAPAPAQP
jgi:hypothetical protein